MDHKSKSKSCAGCKFLYGCGTGYSNYTWEEDLLTCAKGVHAFGQDIPYDWNKDPEADNWPVTQNARCELYSPGPFIVLDPDRIGAPSYTGYDFSPYDFADKEQYDAIAADEGWTMPFDEYMDKERKLRELRKSFRYPGGN